MSNIKGKPAKWCEDLSGRKYGRWTVKTPAPRLNNRTRWFCVCDCGAETTVASCHLKSGKSASCGCLKAEQTAKRVKKHGYSQNDPRGEYRIWMQMIGRCHGKGNTSFRLYGARGIAVCERWRADFTNFIADMGPRPTPQHSIDRIDSNGNYEPSNCRWATHIEQARNTSRNRMVSVNGVSMCLSAAVEMLGLNYGTVKWRLQNGRSDKDALK
jgi:hypothetical protein